MTARGIKNGFVAEPFRALLPDPPGLIINTPPGFQLYAALGGRARMFGRLGRSFRQRDGDMIHFNVLPDFDGPRNDPRYIALARRTNVTPPRM